MSSICFNELANYNAGRLVYQWFDLDQYSDAEEFSTAFYDWLSACPHPDGGECEEWNVADYEDIPEQLVSGYGFNADQFFEWQNLNDDERLVFEMLTECMGYTFADAMSKVDRVGVVHGQRPESYVYDLINECMDLPEIAVQYFDYKAYARDMVLNGDISYDPEHSVLYTNLNSL